MCTTPSHLISWFLTTLDCLNVVFLFKSFKFLWKFIEFISTPSMKPSFVSVKSQKFLIQRVRLYSNTNYEISWQQNILIRRIEMENSTFMKIISKLSNNYVIMNYANLLDLQRAVPWKLYLIKYELDINVFVS